MKYASPIIAAAVVAVLAYAVSQKKEPEQLSERRMEVGTISEAPAPIAPSNLSTEKVETKKISKKIAAKSKPRKFGFAKKSVAAGNATEVAAVTGMTPAASDYNLTAADADNTIKPKNAKNMINPADGRWINELSGQRAKLNMAAERTDLSCDQDYRACDRPEDKREVLVGGLVVKSERLVANPARSIDGQLVRGHYAKKTPAVYVK